MKIENPYDGMSEFVFENVCERGENEVFSGLKVTASEAILPNSIDYRKEFFREFREKPQTICFKRKNGVFYRVKAGDTLKSIAERFSVNEGAVDCGETEDIFPCKVVYINKTEQGEKD